MVLNWAPAGEELSGGISMHQGVKLCTLPHNSLFFAIIWINGQTRPAPSGGRTQGKAPCPGQSSTESKATSCSARAEAPRSHQPPNPSHPSKPYTTPGGNRESKGRTPASTAPPAAFSPRSARQSPRLLRAFLLTLVSMEAWSTRNRQRWLCPKKKRSCRRLGGFGASAKRFCTELSPLLKQS